MARSAYREAAGYFEQALTNQSLGFVYQSQGDYRRAIDCFEQTMALLDEARHRERFGQLVFPAVLTPASLTVCHAELGTFAAGRALQTASKSYLQQWGVKATVLDCLTPYISIPRFLSIRVSFCCCAAWLLSKLLYSG